MNNKLFQNMRSLICQYLFILSKIQTTYVSNVKFECESMEQNINEPSSSSIQIQKPIIASHEIENDKVNSEVYFIHDEFKITSHDFSMDVPLNLSMKKKFSLIKNQSNIHKNSNLNSLQYINQQIDTVLKNDAENSLGLNERKIILSNTGVSSSTKDNLEFRDVTKNIKQKNIDNNNTTYMKEEKKMSKSTKQLQRAHSSSKNGKYTNELLYDTYNQKKTSGDKSKSLSKFKIAQRKRKIREHQNYNKSTILAANFEMIDSLSTFFRFEYDQLVDLCKSHDSSKYFFFKYMEIFLHKAIERTIQMMDTVIKNDLGKKQVSMYVKNPIKLNYFCAFCTDSEVYQYKTSDLETEMIADLDRNSSTFDFKGLLKQLFDQINETFKYFISPELIFASDFFRGQRVILDKILQIFAAKKIFFVKNYKHRYLHLVYHELISENIDLKLYFLPELQSMIYIFLRTSTYSLCDGNNQNFIILFYSFYSLNKFFKYLHSHGVSNMKMFSENFKNSHRIITQSISFVLRISFMQLIFSCLSVNCSAQMRYNYAIMKNYHNELLHFLNEKIDDQYIFHNFEQLISVLILCEYKCDHDLFLKSIKNDISSFYELNHQNIEFFHHFLVSLKQANHTLCPNNELDKEIN